MPATFKIDISQADDLIQAMKNYEGDVEKVINDVLHNEAGPLMQDSIKRLMPVSGRHWQGKKKPAKTANSLRNVTGNLFVTVTTTKNYQYLYFPDDGTNTRRHIGNKQFFLRGAEKVQDEIIERCISRLVNQITD